MTVRAYLRASSKDQNPLRAQEQLEEFADRHGLSIDHFYIETASGTHLDRPELIELLDDSDEGDILLVEQVDRLTRLSSSDWDKLRSVITSRGIRVVSLDLPTSWAMMKLDVDDFTARIFSGINALMLDVLAAVSRKDHDDRMRRQAQGIQVAKSAGRYKGRAPTAIRRANEARRLTNEGMTVLQICDRLNISRASVYRCLEATNCVTESDICDLYDSGLLIAEISSELRMSRVRIFEMLERSHPNFKTETN